MSHYLFLFTIGPVQGFIAQARKTRDLYNGSQLLTKLIDTVFEVVDPIFPQKINDTEKSYPNRFIAIIEKENDTEMKTFGDELKQKVQVKFEELALFAVKETKVDVSKLPKNFDEQISKHLSIQWVAIPYDENNYEQQFKEIESQLGAIKNIREFEQLEEVGRKCSICGERNTLFYNGNMHPYYQSDAIRINNVQLQKGEGLCAVCFTKRFFQEKEFPSTAEIALGESISQLRRDDKRNSKIENYKKYLASNFDYQLFFEHNLREEYFKRQNIDKTKLEKAKELLKEINKIKPSEIKLNGYFAMIMFDGDSMGKWLSGVNIKEDANLINFHKGLTNSLGEFAKKTHSIVKGEKGKVVYAGGEDFLAFINLNHLFDVLKELREEFDKLVNQNIANKKNGANLTFSAGVVIAYYKMPLSEVLNWARKMEKEAKNIDDDKNGLAIAVIKHSGEINQTTIKWSYDESVAGNLSILYELTNDLSNEILSDKFIKNLEDEFRRFPNDKVNSEMLATEMQRLIRNSFIDKSLSKDEKTHKAKEKTEKLMRFFNEMDKEKDNFFSLLGISDFIARQLNGKWNGGTK
ncbi:MAG: type III-B CRISPR-associated protein Cas10/Cmr2 [Melioribacteraceae bacterium]|nr:type III-B CRISPR-associated protein Cas10/Cmr2 [Melioribacteraceae bacterium]